MGKQEKTKKELAHAMRCIRHDMVWVSNLCEELDESDLRDEIDKFMVMTAVRTRLLEYEAEQEKQ